MKNKRILFQKCILPFILLILCMHGFLTVKAQGISSGSYKFKVPEVNNAIKYVSKEEYKRTIFVDAVKGTDTNDGLSTDRPIRTLDKLAKMQLVFGDEILLKGGQVHEGTIELTNLNVEMSKGRKIHIGSYGGAKATLDFKGYPAGIWIQNTSDVIVSDLKLTGNGGPDTKTFMSRKDEKNKGQRYAVRILSNNSIEQSLVKNIIIFNVDIQDIFLLNPVKESRACNQWDMNDGAGWGWGVFGEVLKGNGIRNVDIKYVTVRNVSQMGIRFKGSGKIDGSLPRNVDNVHIENCTVYQSGGPGMQFNKCNNSYMKHCRITESGNRNDHRKWGRGSGMWTWGCVNFLLEYNVFEGAQGIADCCGAHIDFNCRNVVIQYCLSRYNCGGFIEILGLNYNCSYRFNVSINDGWRNMKDKPTQDFWGKVGTPGCLVTVNGHNHDKRYYGPYQSYIYNNTIICTEEGNAPYENPFVFNIATSNRGLVMMNNIFWFAKRADAGWSMHRWKDGEDYDAAYDFRISSGRKKGNNVKADARGSYPAEVRPMNEKELARMGLVMKNNLYKLYDPAGTDKFTKVAKALPEGYWDENALGGDPGFANVNGSEAEDMIPSNAGLINKGMAIPHLESDTTSYGVYFGGLKVLRDFFGNKIKGNIVGAIVPNAQKK